MTDDLPTRPGNERPELVEFDLETSDAPPWAKALYRLQSSAIAEERAARATLERNQRIQIREIRRLSRRVGDHDGELEDHRERLEELEDWRESMEAAG